LENTSRKGHNCVEGNDEVTQHTYVETNPSCNGIEGTGQGNDTKDARETWPTKKPLQPSHQTRRKQLDQRTWSVVWKKQKAQNPQVVYPLTDDDMDQIGYRIRDFTEEFLEDMKNQQEALQKKVQDQCSRLQ
jgi:hypothetical protein